MSSLVASVTLPHWVTTYELTPPPSPHTSPWPQVVVLSADRVLLIAALRDYRRTAGTWTSPSDCSQCVPSCMSTPCPGQLQFTLTTHYLHTIYTLSLQHLQTAINLRTNYSLSTHYLRVIYTQSTQF